MATRANIIIKVPSEYIGKSITFDPTKLHTIVGHGEIIEGKWQGIQHECKQRKPMLITKRYLSIYNHYDGYPSELGKRLLTHYNDLDKALNLLSGGWICGLYDKYYHAAADDTGWGHTSLTAEQSGMNPGLQNAWAYLWNDGEWYVTTWELQRGKKWVKLSELLTSNDPDLDELK